MMAKVSEIPTAEPALNALTNIENEVKKRVGDENGYLKKWLLGQCEVVRGTLMSLEPINNNIKTINQQSELGVRMFRNLSNLVPALRNDDKEESTHPQIGPVIPDVKDEKGK